MANDWFSGFSRLAKGTKARADAVNALFDLMVTGMDKMPSEAQMNRETRNYAADTGSVNAYACSLTHVATAYEQAQRVILFIDAADVNTAAACTLNVSGIGNTAIKYPDGNDPAIGDVQGMCEFRYTGSVWHFMSTSVASVAACAASQAATAQDALDTADDLAATHQDTIDTAADAVTSGNNVVYAAEWAIKAINSAISAAAGGGAGIFSALHWADASSEWAERAEDSAVPANQGGDGSTTFSALHHAAKAQESADSVKGKQTIWIPASAMIPTVSNGCSVLNLVETTAGRPDIQTLDFDASADEHAQFNIAMPKQWDKGTVQYQMFWTSVSTYADGIAFGLQGVAVGEANALDVAYGTAVVVTDDHASVANTVRVTAVSGAITIAGTPLDDQDCIFRIFRDVSDANDDMVADARLLGIKLFYTNNALNDS